MTKREAMRQTHQENTLLALGFTREEAETLRRISMTLHRWFEHECNGTIQRAGEDGDGEPFWYSPETGRNLGRVQDRERGAMRRLQAIMGQRNGRPAIVDGRLNANPPKLAYYIQSDPRGAALYILRPGDVPEGEDAGSYYSRGICVY